MRLSGLLVSVAAAIASPRFQSRLMPEVEAVMVRDSRPEKPHASVRTRKIRNLLKKKKKLLVAAEIWSWQQT